MSNERIFSSNIQEETGSAKPESIIGASILCLLILVGILIFFQQFRFDEARFNTTLIQAGSESQVTEDNADNKGFPDIENLLPGGFVSMSDPEYFNPGTLSDKIDGKADKYLEADFVRLLSQRFVDSIEPENWFELYLYDMGEPRNAYYVYSTQKREDVTDEDFTKYGYSTENALFFAHGKFYTEILASKQEESLIRTIIGMSAELVERYPEEEVKLPERDYLPAEYLDSSSLSLILLNGFGFEKFDNIFTGIYRLDGHRIMAFLSIRESSQDAEALVKDYDNFLSEFIGPERIKPETDEIQGLIIANLFDEYEIFFHKGRLIAGVHAAQDIKAGEDIAVNLYKKISELE